MDKTVNGVITAILVVVGIGVLAYNLFDPAGFSTSEYAQLGICALGTVVLQGKNVLNLFKNKDTSKALPEVDVFNPDSRLNTGLLDDGDVFEYIKNRIREVGKNEEKALSMLVTLQAYLLSEGEIYELGKGSENSQNGPTPEDTVL